MRPLRSVVLADAGLNAGFTVAGFAAGVAAVFGLAVGAGDFVTVFGVVVCVFAVGRVAVVNLSTGFAVVPAVFLVA